MDLPEMNEGETFGEYQKRCNLPHVYVPFFPAGDGGEQVQWQQDLQKQFPTVWIYPYADLNVSKTNEMVYIIFENESQITEMAREKIVRHCCGYGREHAEKAVPSVEDLHHLYRQAAVAA